MGENKEEKTLHPVAPKVFKILSLEIRLLLLLQVLRTIWPLKHLMLVNLHQVPEVLP